MNIANHTTPEAALETAVSDALSVATEQDSTYEYSCEPGSPYVRFLAAAILAALPDWALIRVDDLWNACDCPYHGQEDAYRKVLANHQPYCNLAQEPFHGILRAALGEEQS